MIGNKKEIINFLLNQDDEKQFEINEHRQKRSLNANAYLWILLQKIADALGSTKEEVYKDIIRDKGIFRIVTLDNKSVKTFEHLWTEKGLGWLCEATNVGKTSTDIIAYYGTSSYNTKQMANLIDYIVNQAKEMNIETMTPKEIEELKARWKNG